MNNRLRKALQRGAEFQTPGYAPTSSGPLAGQLEIAVKAHGQGRLDEAEKIYRDIISLDHENFDALHSYGVLLMQQGLYDKALIMIDDALLLQPEQSEAWCNKGTAYSAVGRENEAMHAFRKAIDLNPKSSDAWFNLGNSLLSAGSYDDAIQAYRKSTQLDNTNASAFSNMAFCYFELLDFEESMGAAQRAIQVNPRHAKAYNIYGLGLKAMGQAKEAAVAFRGAIKNDPRYAAAYSNLGLAYLDLGQPAQALEACIQAVQLDEKLAPAQCTRSAALRELGHLDEAMLACQKALQSDPTLPEGHNGLGNVYLDISRQEEAMVCFRRALELRPEYREVHSNLLMAMQYSPEVSPLDLKQEAENWAKLFAPESDVNPPFKGIKKIGFVSGDLRLHPVGGFILGLFQELQRLGIEIYCYANQGMRDAHSEKLGALAKAWRTIVGINDTTTAQIIREDGIDVLVDLSGHTASGRLGVFALRPAPIQVTWLGYSGTTGMPQFDGIIGDRFVTPSSEDNLYTEPVVRLPHAWLCFTPPSFESEIRKAPSEASSVFTFGVFNQTKKISKEAIRLWSSILQTVPNSQILLKSKGLASGAIRYQYSSWFKEFGVDIDRVIFLGTTSWQAHFLAMNKVDLFLDTFPYVGATTTVESLYMGVPVVTMEGPGHVHRMGASLLRQLDLAHFVTSSPEEYAARAVVSATNPSELYALRHSLRTRLLESPICDPWSFTDGFVTALQALGEASASRELLPSSTKQPS